MRIQCSLAFATHRDYGPAAGFAPAYPARATRRLNLPYPRGELTYFP